MRFSVLVKPGASRDEVVPQPDGSLVVRVRAVAEKGRANEAVQELLAAHFGVPRRAVSVLTPRSRRKLVEITNVEAATSGKK